MNFELTTILCVTFFIAVQGSDFPISQVGKGCLGEAEIDETTVREYATSPNTIAEDNEKAEKFFACVYRIFINDTHELVVDDNLKTYTVNTFTARLGGRRKLAVVLAKDALEHCKGEKGESKGKTAIKVVNCLKLKLGEYEEKA